jgi:hypothetical protein
MIAAKGTNISSKPIVIDNLVNKGRTRTDTIMTYYYGFPFTIVAIALFSIR